MDLLELSVVELAGQLASQKVSAVEATRACLARIAKVDGQLKAFLRVD